MNPQQNDRSKPLLSLRSALAAVVLIAAVFSTRGSSEGIWSAVASLPGPRYAHAAADLNGVLHVVGGGSSNAICSFETTHLAYDPVSPGWVAKQPMLVGRVLPGAAVLNDGVKNLLYVVGGGTGCGIRTATMEAYDPDSNTWSYKASMPGGPRSTMGVAVIENILYVVGGQQADSGPTAGIVATVEAYDPITNSWETKQSLPGVRYAMAIGAIDGRLYAAGGANQLSVLDTVYAYDPGSDSWSPRATMPDGHVYAASTVLEGRLYVIGGFGSPGFLNRVSVYEPVSNSWSENAPLPAIRTALAAATVNDLVYAIGGTNGASGLSTQSDVFALDDPLDTIPPVTTATPSQAPNGSGWNNSDVTIALEAADSGAGVQSITYSLSGAQTGGATIGGSEAAVPVTAEGITTLAYHAVDAAGNVEAERTLTVRIDRVAPQVGVPNNIVAAATMSAGAVISFTIQSFDNLSGVASEQASPLLSGMAFPLGTTHETVTVIDAAGNIRIAGFDVTVVPGRPSITITGGTFLADGNPHPATTTATDFMGTPVAGSFNVAYAPGGTTPVAPGRYSATAAFVSGDPAFVSLSPWTTKAADAPRFFASGGVIGGRLYVVGVNPNQTEPFRTSEFNPASNTWSLKSNAPISRNQAGSAVVGSRMYVAGGCVNSDCGSTTNAFAVYDAGTDAWSMLAPMPFARNNVAVAAIGTTIYVAGGGSPFTANTNLQIYDTESNTWTAGAPLPVAVWQAAGAALDGRLYVLGGLGSAGVYRGIVQVYDPATDTWSMAADMPTPRIALAATVVNGRIYAVGGSSAPNGVTAAVESYDPVANAWTVESSLPTARYALVAGAIDGVLYASTGALQPAIALGTTEALDLSLTTHITIEAPVVLESITVSPSGATLVPGATQSFLATGHFSDGSSRVLMTAGEGPFVQWQSGNILIASVNEFGHVQANAPGVVTITASAGSVICQAPACAIVTVSDVTPPVLSLPNDMTVEAYGPSGQPVTWFASAQDNVDGLRAVICAPASGSLFPFGTTTVHCSATDTAGNMGAASFAVTVVDTNPPWLGLPNATLTREATGPGGAVVTYFVSAGDSVDGAITPSCSPASGSQFGFGSTEVTCSATDSRGNSASAAFTVNVQDTNAPFLSIPFGTQTREATNSGGAVVTYTATANDSVDGSVPVTCTPSSGSQFPFGSTTVNCSATDAHGNVRNGSFSVNVQDTNAPFLSIPFGTQTREATNSGGAIVTYTATANDSVDGSVPATCTPSSGSQFPFGSTIVNCSATDAHGNVRNGSFSVNVVDTTAPVIVTPSNITVNASAAGGAVVVFNATAQDAVDGSVAVVCTPASGSLFPIGTTTVSCSAVDSRGNPAASSFVVTVLSTVQILEVLLAEVEDFQQGLNLLQNVLESVAANNVSAACGQLDAFINVVTAQAGKKLTAEEAAVLINIATNARGSLGCGL